MIKRNLYLLFMLIIGVAFAFNGSLALAKDMTANDLVSEAKKNITTISVAEAKAMFDKEGVIFLDCREPKEFKSGHIPGALNIPRGLLEFKIGKEIPGKNTSIVVYCKSGGRASLGCCNLVRMGYKNAVNLDGGWKAWTKAGYPVE